MWNQSQFLWSHLEVFENPYQNPFDLVGEKGNNFFSYQERKNAGSDCVLTVPRLIEWTLDDLRVWKTICFEEYESGKVFSCVGLEKIVRYDFEWKKVIVMDNHNHALFFWIQAWSEKIFQKWIVVIHIDQHSDMAKPDEKIFLNEDVFLSDDQKKKFLSEVFDYVNCSLNIGNFLVPAIDSGLVSEVIQIRSNYALAELEKKIDSANFLDRYILDIDVDFWVEQMGIDEERSMKVVRKLLDRAVLVTVATSPYFIEQAKAIELVRKIFG